MEEVRPGNASWEAPGQARAQAPGRDAGALGLRWWERSEVL